MTNKNDHNYTFLQERFNLYIVLAHNFLKPYISKICNGLSLYIYIYIYTQFRI